MELTESVLSSSYYRVNTIGNDKLFSVLKNDTETIISFIGGAITGATAFVTLLWSVKLFIVSIASDISYRQFYSMGKRCPMRLLGDHTEVKCHGYPSYNMYGKQ